MTIQMSMLKCANTAYRIHGTNMPVTIGSSFVVLPNSNVAEIAR